MKKLLAIVFALFTLSLTSFAEERKISFSAGLQTGIPFYGASSIGSLNSHVNDDGGRIIIGIDGAINFNVMDMATFFFSNDILFDFNFNSSEHANHLHLDFPFGIKVYPGLGGLNLGLAYVFGFRADFIKLDGADEDNSVAAWGNGVKLIVEYNFAHTGSSRFLPSIGGYWKLMPRGEKTWDNMLCLYINANF